MDALFHEQQKLGREVPGGDEVLRRGGRLRRGVYEAHGLYRPEADCIMFTRDPVGFCRVCRRAIERIIDLYSK